MTIDKNYEIVTFWETTTNKKYELKGRIDKEEKEALKDFLTPNGVAKKKEGGGLFGAFGKGFDLFKGLDLGNFVPGVGDDEAEADKKGKENGSAKKGAKDIKKKKADDDDDDAQSKALSAFSKPKLNPEDEEIEGFEDKPRALDELNPRTTSKIARKSAMEAQRKEVQFKDKAGEGRKTFIKMQRDEEAAQELKNDFRHLKPITDFIDASGRSVPKIILPYSSLELIFNNKNIFGNMQNGNPTKIKFHIHNQVHWKPFLFTHLADDKIEAWKLPLGVFYNFKNLFPPIKTREKKHLTDQIYEAVEFGLKAARSGANLETVLKGRNSKEVKHLMKYLRLKEYRDSERISEEEYQTSKAAWEKELKRLMPKNFRYNALPMIFCYNEPERIKSIITKQASQFILRQEKDSIFALAVKVFPYPNGFNSIRVVLAMFYLIPDDELEEELSDDSQAGIDDLLLEDDDEQLNP